MPRTIHAAPNIARLYSAFIEKIHNIIDFLRDYTFAIGILAEVNITIATSIKMEVEGNTPIDPSSQVREVQLGQV